MQPIADTGLLKALLDRTDPYHGWAAEVFPRHAPWITCEPVLTEAAYLSGSPEKMLLLILRGDLLVRFVAADQAGRLLELLQKYQDRNMGLADACLVRMTEMEREVVVYTIDRRDFTVYRRNGNEIVPCVFPPEI